MSHEPSATRHQPPPLSWLPIRPTANMQAAMSRKRRLDPRERFRPRHLLRCAADGKRLYLSIEETAAHFGLRKSAVLEWVRLGLLPEYSLGGRIYLNREEVLAYWTVFQK